MPNPTATDHQTVAVQYRNAVEREDLASLATRLADDGRIVEQTLYCAGVWGPKLQERMAAEAPLVHP